MARVVKKAAERRTEILAAAQGLFLSRGYDATTVNDLLNAVGISKGAFYHHFSAKEDVLQALVWRMAEQGLAALSPIIEREDLGPLEKLKISSPKVNGSGKNTPPHSARSSKCFFATRTSGCACAGPRR